jgi:hypothetical protein
LEQRSGELDQTILALMEQKRVFTEKFASFEEFQVKAASDDITFYAELQQMVRQASGRMRILTTQQRGIRDGRSSYALTLRGDYYDFVKILAEWRKLSTTVRVAGMTLTASRTPETRSEVQIDVTMEAIVSR